MNFEAAVFDMDGVVTRTACVHTAAWKRTFDEFLHRRQTKLGEPFREFTTADYLAYVDGRPRYSGVDTFLRARGIHIPFGAPTDTTRSETICGIGNRKNELFNDIIERDGVDVYPSTIRLIHQMRACGVKVGIATSSKNCALVLERAGIAELFEARVDGVVSAELGLKGKPEPDIFITACSQLGADRERTMVVEDAVSGVQAAARGHFGLVVGVARQNNALELHRNGAHRVVSDLDEISLAEIDCWFGSRAQIQNRYIEVLP